MSFILSKNYKIAIRTEPSVFSELNVGLTKLERKLTPLTYTYSYIGESTAITDIVGYSEVISFNMERYAGNNANDYLFSFVGVSGVDCQTEVFLYNENEKIGGLYIGKVYPASVMITEMSADKEKNIPFYGFGGKIYINGAGALTQKAVVS